MPLRKQIIKEASNTPSGSQETDENTQEEDDALDDRINNDEPSASLLSPSSSREKRRRERENKSKPKEMTEEEMMDLALRLSEQEASITALKLQKEEEAVMKAIQQSMVSQTQLCPPSQSQSLLSDAETSLRLGSRRKLLCSNRKMPPAIDPGASEDSCRTETDLDRGAKGSGDENTNGNKKRKRKEGSPLLEMPDLSQTQEVFSQASPCSSESLSVALDSPQSSDSTQIDDCQPPKSPVFPSTGCRAEVHVPRLSQDLLQTCRTSGFVLCSQERRTPPRRSPTAQPKSPTFPKSSTDLALSKSPVFSETDQGDDGEPEQSPEYFQSPVFGRNTQREKSQSACRPQVCNSGFMFSSQESLTSSTSCRPKSPVFPRSHGLPENLPPPERPAVRQSPVLSESDRGQTEHSRRTSPVFGRTGHRQNTHSASPSAAELRGSGSEESPRQDSKSDRNQDVRLNESDGAEELNETSKDRSSATPELTSDMTLLWSDEDEDVTPVGSPSPVFPEERHVHGASLNHVAAASPAMNGSNCRPSCYSTSTSRQQLSTTEPESRPAGSPETVSGPTVHYYWGVPFCPRGLDPDTYTQVILAQMEVYEKSLKQAQRCLLRKAEWGEAVLPEPEKSPPSAESPAESPQQHVPRRRGLRLRGKKLCEAADTSPAEVDEEEEEEEEERKNEEEKEKQKNGEEGQEDTDCEVCPETQLSGVDDDDDRTQDLMMATDDGAELRPKSPESEIEMILRDDLPAVGEREEEMEVDAPVDRKTKETNSSNDVGGQNVRKKEVEEDAGNPDVGDIKDRGLQRSTSPELERAAVPRSPETNVDCPICQGSFPATEIEMHAAYCDGEVALVDERRPETDCFQVSMKPRRKRARSRAEVTDEESNDHSNTGKNQEKCYICLKAFPLREYSRHTELCIQRQASKTKGNLLSALERTESRSSEAGPSGSKLQPAEVIDLRDDDDDEEEDEEKGGVSVPRISNSPIRAFTPISEATGCLIDFKKQRVKKLSQRRR
ncbi:BRCA1-A complex subunit RAP80 isoform X2 [Micropterus dolomieu]|nr:BRCA1-A complex subunit RAP80 isoform X2 [Micropterus dolomieu]